VSTNNNREEISVLDPKVNKSEVTGRSEEEDGVTRRGALECMLWTGTGVLWALSGDVPKSVGLLGDALAAEAPSFSFLQISDSHIGFNKPANPYALGTLKEAIARCTNSLQCLLEWRCCLRHRAPLRRMRK
jgi:hypothetical protein